MACWNGLSFEQQVRLLEHGNLPWGYEPEGTCPNGAEVEVTTMWDVAPGPRFYCRACAAEWLGRPRGEPVGEYSGFEAEEFLRRGRAPE